MIVNLQMTCLPSLSQIGPLFDVIPLPSGVSIPTQVNIDDLLSPNGIDVLVPDGTTSIQLQSLGICNLTIDTVFTYDPDCYTTTTSTTTIAPPTCSPVCYTFEQESWNCTSQPNYTTLINGKPYYEIYGCDCETPVYYLWYDAIGVSTFPIGLIDFVGTTQGYWVVTQTLGVGPVDYFFPIQFATCPYDSQTSILYSFQEDFENPGYPPTIGTINQNSCSCNDAFCMTLGQASEQTSPNEQPAIYQCVSSAIYSSTLPGNVYYEVYDTDCTTIIAYLYRGDDCTWWVTSVLGDINSTKYARIFGNNLYCVSDFDFTPDPGTGIPPTDIQVFNPLPNDYFFTSETFDFEVPCDSCNIKIAVQYNIEAGSFCYEAIPYTPYINFRPHYPVYLSDGITLFGYIWYSNVAYDLLNGPGWYLTTALNDFTTVYSYLKWTDLLNPEPAPPSEPIEGGGWTWVSNFVAGVGITNTQIGCCCNCPQGFNVLPNNDGCQKITTVLPTPGTVEIPGDGVPSSEYGNLGVRIYNVDDYNLQGDSISSTYAYTNPTSFWNNRMNNALIWESGNACWPGSVGGVSCLPVGENVAPYPGTLGMCDTITLQETKIYYIGVGGDNGITIKINGVTILSQDISIPLDPLNFNYWHIYPVVLNAGTNIIEIQNTNVSNIGGFAAEIYNNTLSQLTSATDIDFVNVVFSTQSYRTGGPNEGEAFCNTYSCPEGFIYNPDSGLCTKIETLECGEQPTTSTTTTTTIAPPTTSTTTSTTLQGVNTIFTHFDTIIFP